MIDTTMLVTFILGVLLGFIITLIVEARYEKKENTAYQVQNLIARIVEDNNQLWEDNQKLNQELNKRDERNK